MNRIAQTILTALCFSFAVAHALAQDDGWPRTVTLDEGAVTIYAPKVEALDGDVLYYRAAVAYRAQADAEPVFGAGWFKSPVDIDEGAGTVRPAHLELTQTRFPEGTADIQAELATALARKSSGWDLDFTVAELEAALEAAEAESLAAQKIKTAPPKVIYRDQPALLVTIDGDPVLREIEDSPYEAVINTPFPLITDGDDYYLNAANGVWYRANAATGPYRFDSSPPAGIVQMVEAAAEGEEAGEAPVEKVTAENAPEIVVSTEPAELIVTEGPADFVPLVDDLLVLENSDDDVFMHVGTQKYYIVLAGRWYTAPSLEGPWKYQAADELPADFANIPDDSAQADSRVYVAGTQEAEEAVLDAHVPQTAKVERGEVDIDVEYDGEPDFEPVEGTEDLEYARNTGATVIHSDRVYYLLEDGVWYTASSPHGPWVVSDHRPGELESVAPSSPVYHTKYVYVYDSTPEVVYVGYTPGYLGSYVYANTIVYGTGYYYRPWVSPYYYYPRPRTWGFHVGYNDWSGWSFGLSWYWAPFSLSYYTGGYWHYGRPWHNRYWGYWGPRGYCYRPYYHGGYRHKRYAYGHYGKGHGNRYWDRGKYGYRDHDRWDKGYGRHDGRRHDRWDDDYGRYDRERRRNLYRDERQRARVADSRDVWNTNPDWREDPRPGRGDSARIVDNRKVRQASTGPVRATNARTEPISQREIRARAVDRDVAADFGRNQSRDVGAVSGRERSGKIRQSRPEPISQREIQARAANRDVAADFGRDRAAKARQSRPEPISQREIQARAANHDVAADFGRHRAAKARESRPEPISQREIQARAANRDAGAVSGRDRAPKVRQSRTEPIAQKQARERAERMNKVRQSRTEPIARSSTAGTRNVVGAVSGRDQARNNAQRRAVSPPRQVKQRTPQTRPNREAPAPSRTVKQRQSRTEPMGAPSRSDRAISRSSRSAPIQRAPQQRAQRSAPVRSAPQRSVPQRSAPQRGVPQRSAPQRSAPQRQSRPARGQARKAEPTTERAPSRGKSRERRRNN